MWPLFGRFEFDLTANRLRLCVGGVAAGGAGGARRLIHSPFGLSLRGIRENCGRMPAIGAPSRMRLHTVYTIAATMAGVAGGLLGQTTQSSIVDSLGFDARRTCW